MPDISVRGGTIKPSFAGLSSTSYQSNNRNTKAAERPTNLVISTKNSGLEPLLIGQVVGARSAPITGLVI